MRTDNKNAVTMDPSGFVVLAEYIPAVIQEIAFFLQFHRRQNRRL